MDVCSIFLQVPTYDEDTFPIVRSGEFLGQMNVPCLDGLKVLKVPALGEYDINLESITDLIGEKVNQVTDIHQ